MFKKSLLALALAGVAMSASAVEFNAVTAKTVSVEGLTVSGKAVTAAANAISLKSAAEYSVGDLIEFTVSGAEFDIESKTFSLTDTPATNNSTVTFGPIVKEAGKLVFRVTAVTAPTTGTPTKSTVGNTFTLTDNGTGAANVVDFKVASIAKDGKVVVTSKATIGSTTTEIDKAKDNTATVFTGKEEYTVTIASNDGVVDVKELRKAFATTPAPKLTVAYSAADVSAIDFTSYNLAATGDFTGVSSFQFGATATDVLKIADDKKSAAADFAEGKVETANVAFAFNLPAKDADKVALTAPQTFNLTVTGKSGSNSHQLKSGKLSAWTLNGASADIAFLPFGDRYAQAVYVTNKGTVEGTITVDLIAGGKTYTGNVLTKKAAANTVTNIGPEIMELVKTKAITATEISMKIVVNSPDTDVTISGLYYDKTDADRVKVK
jgi:hypothetical protein